MPAKKEAKPSEDTAELVVLADFSENEAVLSKEGELFEKIEPKRKKKKKKTKKSREKGQKVKTQTLQRKDCQFGSCISQLPILFLLFSGQISLEEHNIIHSNVGPVVKVIASLISDEGLNGKGN